MLPGAPIVSRHRPGTPNRWRSSALRSKPPAASSTPRAGADRAPAAVLLDDGADDGAVLDDQLDQRAC